MALILMNWQLLSDIRRILQVSIDVSCITFLHEAGVPQEHCAGKLHSYLKEFSWTVIGNTDDDHGMNIWLMQIV